MLSSRTLAERFQPSRQPPEGNRWSKRLQARILGRAWKGSARQFLIWAWWYLILICFRFPIRQPLSPMTGTFHLKSPTQLLANLKIGWTMNKTWFQVSQLLRHAYVNNLINKQIRHHCWKAERLGRGNGWRLGSSFDKKSIVWRQRLRKMGTTDDCQSWIQRQVACTIVG